MVLFWKCLVFDCLQSLYGMETWNVFLAQSLSTKKLLSDNTQTIHIHVVSQLSKCLKIHDFLGGMFCHTHLNASTSVKLLRLYITINFTKDVRK